MSCKHYKAQLMESAAAREPVRPALQAHLASCEVCRERYGGEQALFAAIDTELSLIANAEPTASFAPRMRDALQQEPPFDNTARERIAWWPRAAALAAVCVVAAMVMFQFRTIRRGAWPTSMPVVSTNDATRHRQSSAPTHTAPNAATPNVATSNVASASVAVRSVARAVRQAPRSVAERSAEDEAFQAEMLVPLDERDALARFIANLQRRQDDQVALSQPVIVPSSGAASQSATLTQPAEVLAQPLEIAELKVDPLRPAEEK
jgi:hypothetical protein